MNVYMYAHKYVCVYVCTQICMYVCVCGQAEEGILDATVYMGKP